MSRRPVEFLQSDEEMNKKLVTLLGDSDVHFTHDYLLKSKEN